MPIKCISDCTFSLEPLHQSAYALHLQFLDEKGSKVSQKSFTFSQQVCPQEGELVDIYSQNGQCQDPLFAHLFTKSDLKAVQAVLKQPLPPGPLIYVLDLQDPHTGYGVCSECHRRSHSSL